MYQYNTLCPPQEAYMDMEGVFVFIFRRDMRLVDNSAFIAAARRCRELGGCRLLPSFIFNACQMDPTRNPYYGERHARCMMRALRDLSAALPASSSLWCLDGGGEGDDCAALEALDLELRRDHNARILGVGFNADVTPFAARRDERIRAWCQARDVEVICAEDYTMLPIEKIRTSRGAPFDVFTQYWRKAMHADVPAPAATATDTAFMARPPGVSTSASSVEDAMARYIEMPPPHCEKSMREEALEILERVRRGAFRSYKKAHELPAREDATTRLGPYIKFGCVSIREVYAACKSACGRTSKLVENLFAREFNYALAHAFPNEILCGQVEEEKRNLALYRRYERAPGKWSRDEVAIRRWQDGATGVPLVDAAMRCLDETGWINGKLRAVAAMFLVRELNVDWREGERYFATKLIDYDPISNNAGWFWLLAQRRPMNPYKHAGKLDPQCVFIKRWVPELRDVPVLDVICWFEAHGKYPDLPQPMIDVPGYRVKMKRYVPDYVRPKAPNQKDAREKRKTSKYAGSTKNVAKYDKQARRQSRQESRQEEPRQIIGHASG